MNSLYVNQQHIHLSSTISIYLASFGWNLLLQSKINSIKKQAWGHMSIFLIFQDSCIHFDEPYFTLFYIVLKRILKLNSKQNLSAAIVGIYYFALHKRTLNMFRLWCFMSVWKVFGLMVVNVPWPKSGVRFFLSQNGFSFKNREKEVTCR